MFTNLCDDNDKMKLHDLVNLYNINICQDLDDVQTKGVGYV